MKKIIIINGTGGSGKDTFVSFCEKYAKVYNFSTIDKVKGIAKFAGWNGEKDEKSRKFLSDLKKITSEYNDLPFKSMMDASETFINSDKDIMFIHIREPENIERAKKELKAKTLLIKRVGLKNIDSNDSDANVDNYNYDIIIENSTLEDLELKAQNFVKELEEN